ncbi:hypothetical protein OPV22_008181 [Ensete ventricosum]|uniref:TCP domain-containing protein n=1 Tax=Ensete ventricosum TaxID=4639 RepID=A0AAV8R7P5_ENSVE|nr:hypothetical protein OPV22_008181 [Ensete ventricosum]RWW53638.1 hypothetical protein BHE74_00039853 [Ensete ventricosum]
MGWLYKGIQERKVRSPNPTPHLKAAADKITVDAGDEPSPPPHMDASPAIATAEREEDSSNCGGEDKRNVGVSMTTYRVVLFLKLNRDLGPKSNSETMEWLLRFARPTCGVDRGMRRLLFSPLLVPHFYILGRDLGHNCLHGGKAPNSSAP